MEAGIFQNFQNIRKKIRKLQLSKIFPKNFQTIGFFTAQQRTLELEVNNKGNHNASQYYFVTNTSCGNWVLVLRTSALPFLLNLLLLELVRILHLQIPKIRLFRKPKLAKFRKLHASEKYPFYSTLIEHMTIFSTCSL